MANVNDTFNLNVLIAKEREVVQVSRSWCVFDLKLAIGERKSIRPELLHVIFAGTEIPDSFCFSNCDLTNGSVLHVLVEEENAVSVDGLSAISSLGPTSVGLSLQLNGRHRARFYVFCKTCKKVCIGKLRVRCKLCKDQGFKIHKEPDCWGDILGDVISGECLNQNCPGTMASFFFKCGEHIPCEDERDEAFPLKMLRTNTINVPCLVCMDVKEIVLVFPCQDMHTVCLDCFSTYCQTQINSRQFHMVDTCKDLGYTVVCPGTGETCNSAYIDEPHHFRIPGDHFYSRYQNFAAEDLVLQNGGVLCPGVNCGNGLLPSRTQQRVYCDPELGGCGHVFCRLCLNAYHSGLCSNQGAQMLEPQRNTISVATAQRAQWDISSRAVIRKISKPCPHCKIAIQKDGGCNHMTCTKCRYEFCWLCLIQWNGDCRAEHWFLV